MNSRIIKIAYAVALVVFLLMGAILAGQPARGSGQENANQGSSGQQNRNANRRNRNANTNANANANSGMSGNDNANAGMGGNMNTSGGNMNMSGGANTMGQGPGLSAADRKFVMEAAMGGMEEVELGRVAAQQGTSDAVKQFGQRMVDDHSRANQQLMQLASSKGITLPTELDAKHRADVTKMQQLSGAAFDTKYAKEMVKDHVKDVALFQKQAAKGMDPDIKAFASSTLPTLQEHLTMARALGPTTGGSMNANTGGAMNSNTGSRSKSNKGNRNANSSNANNSNRR